MTILTVRAVQRLTLAAACLAQGMMVLDVLIVSVALPSMQRELRLSPSGLEWVVSAYALVLAALIPCGGAIGDHFGRKRVFVAGVALFTLDMLEELIAGERSPGVLAGLARGKMKAKRAALAEALTGQFDDHHAELARMLLDQIDALTAQTERLTRRVDELIAAMPAARGVDAGGVTGPGAGEGPDAAVRPAIARLDETGVSARTAQVILAEVGLDMSRFPAAGHLVSWAKLPPRTIQSGPRSRDGKTGKGNPYLKGALGEAAAGTGRKTRNHVRQLEAPRVHCDPGPGRLTRTIQGRNGGPRPGFAAALWQRLFSGQVRRGFG
jgi:hypothetical protein